MPIAPRPKSSPTCSHTIARHRTSRTIIALIVASACILGASFLAPAAGAAENDCQDTGYSCTPGYNGTNANSTWAGKYYGNGYATTPTGTHNCTLYAAWRLQQAGMRDPGKSWGNAVSWASAIGGGNRTPAVGSIAWWGAGRGGGSGHVAYVEQVSGDRVFLRADNFLSQGGYTTAGWTTASSVEQFLHPFDQPNPGGGSAPGPRRNTSNVNADGNDDLMLLTQDPGPATGANIGWSTNAGFWMQPEWWKDPYTDWAAMKPMVGDVTGDGRADLVYLVPTPNGSAAYVLPANSSGNGFVQPATLWWDGSGHQFGGIKPALGDVNADGKEDLVLAFRNNGTTISVALSSGGAFALQPAWWTDPYTDWSHFTMTVGDVNSDGTADVSYLVPNGNGTAAYVLKSTNHSFVAAEKWWYGDGWGWSGIKTVMGDFDGNGYTDIGLITNQPGGGTAFTPALSTGRGFLVQGAWWADANTDWNVMKPFAGNFTGDTFNNGTVTSPIDDFGFLVPSASLGPRAFILPSHRTGLDNPTDWWHDSGYGFDGTKVAARN